MYFRLKFLEGIKTTVSGAEVTPFGASKKFPVNTMFPIFVTCGMSFTCTKNIH